MILILLLFFFMVVPNASAHELSAPPVPASGADLMPEVSDNLGDSFLQLIQNGLSLIHPHLQEAFGICISILAVILLIRITAMLSDRSRKTQDLICCIGISLLFLRNAGALFQLASGTIRQLSEYGRLLIPVMASALAAQGGITGSAAIYAGTLAFDSVLTGMIEHVLLPLNSVFLALCIAGCSIGEDLVNKLAGGVKWLCVWSLKIILYVFTGYIGITGVVSGTTDAAALKATKLTISGLIPVVGGILSDASEAVLVTAAMAKNAAGVYGIFALLSLLCGPFLKIGVHYLMLRITSIICQILGEKRHTDLLEAFCTSMGLLLAMTGSVCLLLMISVVCFLRGVG